MGEEIRLVRPTREMEEAAMEFRQEFIAAGELVINGSELLDKTESYADWLSAVTRNASAQTVSKDWVVTDTFFAVRPTDGRIVGIIDLRHTLNDFLKDFGHSGYSVRPTERCKGYGSRMLGLLLDVARESGMDSLQLSVERENAPSVKTIVKNGGEYARSFRFEEADADIYTIRLK